MSKKEKYYWNLKGECFAGKKFGGDVTEYFENDEERCEKYLATGKIVTSKPIAGDEITSEPVEKFHF